MSLSGKITTFACNHAACENNHELINVLNKLQFKLFYFLSFVCCRLLLMVVEEKQEEGVLYEVNNNNNGTLKIIIKFYVLAHI